MPDASLLHNGLFNSAASRGIYWLRAYRLPNGRHLAVVTEVPGNPGMSVINAASVLRSEIARLLRAVDAQLDLCVVWPRRKDLGQLAEGAEYTFAPGPADPDWHPTTRRKLEAIVGRLPELPAHDALFQAVLAQGGRKHEWARPIFKAVPVTSLPPFHGAYQCAHHARFESMLAGDSFEQALAAGRRFMASLTAADRAKCRYHQGDWKAIANASVDIVAKVDGRNPDAYPAAAQAVRLPTRDTRWLLSLFRDPIVLNDGRKSYNNGQHRGCALRFSGAPRAAVVVDFETIVDDFPDWTYLGDG